MKDLRNRLKILLLLAVLVTMGISVNRSADATVAPICFCTDSAQVCCVVEGVTVIGKKHVPTEIE